jgi:hypothetical protein
MLADRARELEADLELLRAVDHEAEQLRQWANEACTWLDLYAPNAGFQKDAFINKLRAIKVALRKPTTNTRD